MKLLKGEKREYLKKTFQLCKENLQKNHEYVITNDENDDEESDSDYSSWNRASIKETPKNKWDSDYDVDCDVFGVIDGIVDEENWRSSSGIDLPLTFLRDVGIFEIPQSCFEDLTLTAQHLSFVEFFAAVGILISEDIKAEFEKKKFEKNHERFKAVSIYIRNFF